MGGGLTAADLVSAFTYLGGKYDFLSVFADDLDPRFEFIDQFRITGLTGWVLPTGALCLVTGPRSTPLRQSDVLWPDVLLHAAAVARETRGGPLRELAGDADMRIMLVSTYGRARQLPYPHDWQILLLMWESWRCGWTGWTPKGHTASYAWYQEQMLPKTWPPQLEAQP